MIEEDSRRTVRILSDLVAIPSVNPREGATDGGESRVAGYLAGWASQHGWECRLDEAVPGRHNAYVEIPGTLQGTILLQTHTDTVETEAMTVPAFAVQHDEAKGTVTGRGVCDAKGQLAMFMAAIEGVVAGGHPRHSVLLAACVDEEHRYRGVTALCADFPSGCVGGVVGEPTELRMVAAQKGVMRCTITITGPGGHSSKPDQVPNPIAGAAEIVTYISQTLQPELTRRSEPLVGAGSIAVTTISGGEAINIIPTRVEIQVDRRTLPSEDPEEVWRNFRRDIENRWPHASVAPPSLIDHGLPPALGSPFHDLFQSSLATAGGDPEPIGVPFGSDASKIVRCGIPVVVFGAGSIDQAHTPTEFVPVAELVTGRKVIESLLTGGQSHVAV